MTTLESGELVAAPPPRNEFVLANKVVIESLQLSCSSSHFEQSSSSDSKSDSSSAKLLAYPLALLPPPKLPK